MKALPRIVSVNPSTTAGAYSALDVVGGRQEFNTGEVGGILTAVILADADDVKAAGTVYFFDQPPTSLADNAAISGLVDADRAGYIGKITIAATDYEDLGGFSVAWVPATQVIVYPPQALYAYFVCSGTPTYVSTTGLIIRVVLL